jgi:Zn-dependent peptidase ImmA (M78 family)
MGIPVIPLSDPVRFHGSSWRIHDRNVIVLKQSVRAESRWLFDLAHELHHTGEKGASSFARIEADGTDPERRDSEDEKAANDFAGNALLGGKAEDLYSMALEMSRHSIPLLKRAVNTVSQANSVNVGILANYVAYRLNADAYADWWGAAANLQPESEDAFTIAASVFRRRFDFSMLSEDDRRIVELATSEPAV